MVRNQHKALLRFDRLLVGLIASAFISIDQAWALEVQINQTVVAHEQLTVKTESSGTNVTQKIKATETMPSDVEVVLAED